MHPDAARRCAVWFAALVVAVAIAGCGTTTPVATDGKPRASKPLPADAVPRPEPRSKYGNPPVYEVFGENYTVLPSSHGYRERGVASWYGKKFHGRLTSNREPYDMHAMTAAHKSLPLPTYVRVRNLKNDRTVVVRVNDRGPFVHNRIIDLSYAAAQRLDMVDDGTSLVEVTAITFDEPDSEQPLRTAVPPATPAPASAVSVDAAPASSSSSVESGPQDELHTVYAQVGAFGSRENAERRLRAIRQRGINNVSIDTDGASVDPLYRVHVGPITEVIQYDMLVEELDRIGIDTPYLVTR